MDTLTKQKIASRKSTAAPVLTDLTTHMSVGKQLLAGEIMPPVVRAEVAEVILAREQVPGTKDSEAAAGAVPAVVDNPPHATM